MKKRIITIIVAALALLTFAVSTAAADAPVAGDSGVLVKTDDGYIISGTLRNADGKVVGTLHGTLTELTTGFNTCPIIGTASALCFPEPPGGWTCNLLGGDVALNFQGTQDDASVSNDAIGHAASALCQNADRTAYDRLVLFMWSTSHVTPGTSPISSRSLRPACSKSAPPS